MDQLPPELLSCIAEHCHHADQKQLRQVNKNLRDAATPFVFEEVYLAMFNECLDKLGKISQDEDLAKHVKKLTLFADVLPAFDSIGDWAGEIDMRPSYQEFFRDNIDNMPPDEVWTAWTELSTPELGEQQLTAGWETYSTLFEEQKQWSSGKQTKQLKSILFNLPNLVIVHTALAYSAGPRADDLPIWRWLCKSIHLGPLKIATIMDNGNETEDLQGWPVISLLQSIHARRAAAPNAPRPCKPIMQLNVQAHQVYAYTSQERNDERYGQLSVKMDLMISAFADLTRLDILNDVLPIPEEQRLWANELNEFLLTAKQLKKLNLSCFSDLGATLFLMEPPADNELHSRPLKIFEADAVVWPNIESLSLSVPTPARALLNFLRLHSGSLRRLCLRSMFVGNVPALLEGIPKAASLDRVYCEKLRHDPTELESPDGDEGRMIFLDLGTDFDADYEIHVREYLHGKSDLVPNFMMEDPLECTKNEREDWHGWTEEDVFMTMHADEIDLDLEYGPGDDPDED